MAKLENVLIYINNFSKIVEQTKLKSDKHLIFKFLNQIIKKIRISKKYLKMIPASSVT